MILFVPSVPSIVVSYRYNDAIVVLVVVELYFCVVAVVVVLVDIDVTVFDFVSFLF